MKNIDPQEANRWREESGAVIVDVREPDEYARGHIPEAINIPLSSIGNGALTHFSEKKVVMQCNTGARSSRACQRAKNIVDADNIYNLEGGIEAWKQAGLEVESDKAGLSINRQVRVTAGALVVVGIVLAYVASPWFVLISLVVGLGLMNAGITGWCGMAKVLTKMPWNN